MLAPWHACECVCVLAAIDKQTVDKLVANLTDEIFTHKHTHTHTHTHTHSIHKHTHKTLRRIKREY
jgi:hypothetical protein